ncbi:MAG: TSUP family transporter [Porticoccaceae bacterium]
MIDLSWLQLGIIAIIFVWSGFVRSGLGFGGALFTLPFLLLIHNDPLFFLPIISLHLLFFAGLTVIQSERGTKDANSTSVNWQFVRYSLLVMIVPKLAGVVGLLVLPTALMNLIIFSLIAAYSLTYILGKPLQSNSRLIDIVFLIAAAYISGTSLIGGPLVIAVAMRHIRPHEFRNTLFVIWWILVSIKLCAFVIADVDIQLLNALWLLPFAGIGHLIGHRFHKQLLQRDSASFYRILGWILLGTAIVGISQVLA